MAFFVGLVGAALQRRQAPTNPSELWWAFVGAEFFKIIEEFTRFFAGMRTFWSISRRTSALFGPFLAQHQHNRSTPDSANSGLTRLRESGLNRAISDGSFHFIPGPRSGKQ